MQETLSSWGPEVAACQLIFYRAVGPFNRSVLFGGKSSPLNKGDARLRPVPFPTRRATFSEVQRVHSVLATVTVYGESTVNTAPRRVIWRQEFFTEQRWLLSVQCVLPHLLHSFWWCAVNFKFWFEIALTYSVKYPDKSLLNLAAYYTGLFNIYLI